MKKKNLIFSAILTLTLLLTSCGGTKPTTSNNASDSKKNLQAFEEIKATNPEKVPDVAKNRKDTLIVGIFEMEGKFLSIYSGTVYDTWVAGLVSDGLIGNDENGNPIPNVADKWDISQDEKTYTFHLKQGVKFSNGDELTTEDVEFTYLALSDPNYDGARSDAASNLVGYEDYNKGNANKISGIKIIDKYTISFTGKEIKASALISDFGYGILPKKVFNFKKGDIAALKSRLLKPEGTGAYIFKGYKPGQEVTFEANPNYFKGAPKIKNLILKVTSKDTLIQQLKTGEVDINVVNVKPENIEMIKSAGFLNLQIYPRNGYGYLGLNTRLDKFKDKKVRQALVYGLNREGFVKAYYQGYAEVCNSTISKVLWAYTDNITKYEYNPEKANKLLDEAGWKMGNDGYRYKDGKKFSIRWATYTGSKYVDTLIPILKENWKKLGIEVIPELMDFGTLCTKVNDKQDFEMFNMGWFSAIDPDQSNMFSKNQAVPGGFNAGGWWTEESEKLLDEGLRVTDQNKRKEIYEKWQQVETEEVPVILLEQAKEMYAVSSRVKGIKSTPFTDWSYYIHEAELEKY